MIRIVKALISSSLNSQHTSLLDVLRDFTPYRNFSGDHPVPIIFNDDTAGLWQNMDVEDTNFLAGHELQDDIGNSQDVIFEDRVAFEVKGLQAEANAMLNPEWTLRLDDFAIPQDTEASVGTNPSHAKILDPRLHGQHVDLGRQASEVQQAGYAYLQGTGPEYTDMSGSFLTSPKDLTSPFRAQWNTIQRTETANNNNATLKSPKPLCPMPVPTTGKFPKTASKRKRIKTALSRKKPCLTPSHHTHNEDSSSLESGWSSKLTLRTEAVNTTTTNRKMSSNQPSYEYTTGHPRVDWMPASEQGSEGIFYDAGTVSDIKISNSERRPMSWPHRNPWRKSLDISVAVLTKGFERMMTDKEASLSAV